MWNLPAAPQSLTATAGPSDGEISLSWTAPAYSGPVPIEEYEVHRSLQSGGPYNYIATTASTGYVDSGLEGQPYYYVVKAVNAERTSLPSNEATTTATGPAPGPGDGFDATKYEPESWTGNTPFGGAPVKSPCNCPGASASVNLAVGEFVGRFPLMNIRNDRGSDFDFTLTHRSIGNPGGNASLSWGWDASWLRHLEADGSDFLFHTGDGRIVRFMPAGGGTYDGPPGSYSKLVPGSGGDLELRDRDGNTQVFDDAIGYKLTEVEDPAGNTWNLEYSITDGTLTRITDPHDRAFTFEYLSDVTVNPFYAAAGQPLLLSITDFEGRQAILEYDHATGNVHAVRTPGPDAGTTTTTRFGYDDFGVIKVWDNEGQQYLRVLYDEHGRVVAQERLDGQGNTHRHTFTYDYDGGTTIVRDPNGNEVEWNLEHDGSRRVVPSSKTKFTHGLRDSGFEDPAQYVTVYEYNDHDELTKVTFPRGNSVSYEYDEAASSLFSQGNLLREVRDPGDVRGLRDTDHYQDQVVTKYEYDPTYNVVTKIIEPRGTDSGYDPQNGGNQSAARYTTRIYYDFEEATLGDLNGDGVTSYTDRRPVRIEYPTVNPAGSSVHSEFTADYKNQVIMENLTWNAAGQLVKRVDPQGIVETRTYYGSNGNSLDPSDREGYLKTVTVDDGGLGLTTTYEYTPYGAVTKTTDPKGNVRQYTVDERGRTVQETGPAPTAYRTKWTYDANDNPVKLERETDASSGVYATRDYAYDRLDRLTTETVNATRPAPIPTALAGQPSPPADSYSMQYEYDGNDNLVQRTNGAGDVEAWSYDERNLLLFQSVGEGNGTYTYDDNGNPLAHEDRRGALTWYQHDGYDRPAARIDAHGTVHLTHYDPAGNVVRERAFAQTSSRVAPDGRPTQSDFDALDATATQKQYERTYRYDEANQAYRVDEEHFLLEPGHEKAPTTGTLSAGDDWVTTLHEYDENGQRTRTVNDNRHETLHAYDDSLRPVSATDAIGNRVAYTYDANGNVATMTETEVDDSGTTVGTYTTTYTYDSEDRPTEVENPDGTTKTYEYDGRSNRVASTDELGNVVRTFYDHADRPWLTSRELRTGGATPGAVAGYVNTTTHWDGADRPLHRCDDNDGCTTYTYASGLLAKETHPDGITVQHGYDANGNRIQTTYNNGRVLDLAYDDLDRLVQLDVERDPDTFGTAQQTFTYDPMGRLTRATDDGITRVGPLATRTATVVLQSHDSLGRLVSESQNGQGVEHVRDGVGNTHEFTYPNDRIVTRTYDALERLQSVEDAKGFIAGLDYDGSRVVEKRFGSDSSPVAKTTRGYDSMRRINDVNHRDGGGSSRVHVSLVYNDAGYRTAQHLFPGPSNELDQLMTLDSLYRTTKWERGDLGATPTTISNVQQTQAWDYDGANNWDSVTRTGTTCLRSHDAGNQLTSEQCGTAPTEMFPHDGNGNIQEDDDFRYYYDFLNRLVRVDEKATGDALVAFGYDALGRRVVKVSNEDQLGVRTPQETWYTFSGQHVVQESQPLRVEEDPLSPFGFNAFVRVIRQWSHGEGVDEILEMTVDDNGGSLDADDERFFYVYDAHGSVIGLTDESGDLVEGYTYDAFGKPSIRRPGSGFSDVQWDSTDTITTTGPGFYENPFLFTGRYWDAHIDKYHYRARTYDPELGRFLSRDPIGVWGDEGNLGNAYAYVGNSPWQYRDPFGMESLLEQWGGENEWVCNAVTGFIPGIGTGCAAVDVAEDIGRDGSLCNAGGSVDRSLCWANAASIGLDLIPGGGTLAKVGAHGGLGVAAGLSKVGRGAEAATDVSRGLDDVASAAARNSDELRWGRSGAPPRADYERIQEHVLPLHGREAPTFKSRFFDDESVAGLIGRASNEPPTRAANGNDVRVFHAGRDIGIDRVTGRSTPWTTVVSRPDGGLVTAHPGVPSLAWFR